MLGLRFGHAVRAILALAALEGAVLGAAQPAAALDSISYIATGSGNSPDWLIYIARAKGFFKDNNLQIDMFSAQSTAAVIQQVIAGSGQIGGGGLTDPLFAMDQGAKVALLRIQMGVPPYSLWAKPSIKTFKDLRGKTIIVGGAKDITRIYFERMVTPNGLSKNDYDLIYSGTTSARYAALASGGADAAILLPPFSFRAEGQGYSLIGRLSDYVKDIPFTGLVVGKDWAIAHKPLLVAFLRAYQRASDWFYAPANKAEAVNIFVTQSNQSKADVEQTYDYLSSINAFARDGTVTPSSLATIVKVMSAQGDLTGSADPARFVDPEISKLNTEISTPK
jgi:ABC-type nitrate/sulfonate/bicarbonate transport system substrate-binding protein